MVAADYQSAVRAGTMAAARLHQELGLRHQIEAAGGNIDVFAAIHALDLPLLVRPLQGLLGAYLSDPAPGVLVTTQRPMSIQRFTAAHELGHFRLRHQPSLDDEENILRRMPLQVPPGGDFQEVEANAFAAEFMMPRWLIAWHTVRQGWTAADFQQPNVVYQLSLRIGASYEATCWTLARQRLILSTDVQSLLRAQPREMKIALLEAYRPQDYRGDVWLLTERDAGAKIDGSRNDLFVLRLQEHSGGGYLWNIDQLKESGFAVVRDDLQIIDAEGIGGPTIRHVTAAPPDTYRGQLAIDERRPWAPDPPLTTLTVELDLTGPEQEGFSRAERRRLLEAA
ncbi:MAG: ImmA/IrrE family metallo-endopeptidase [Rhodospirillales bacterium]|nr:ImmA/IrrE family metallo-endopeptidase [Rhodospirillales bacterium]